MPRIRKKTSKRGQTHQREKIKHKVAETRKKRKKEAKKNPQWKSKHKKDPGIPNNFPYKDQILAEVAEQRRKAEEAKQKKREQKKAAKVAAAGAAAGGEDAVEEDEESGEEEEKEDISGVFDGVMTVRAAGSSKKAKTTSTEDRMDVDVVDAPVAVDSELSSLKDVLEEADVIVEVLDARDPLAYHSEHLAELVKAKESKKLLLVLNKIDASPREAVSSWSTHLRAQYPTVLFRSASAFMPSIEPVPSKGKGKARADDAVGIDSVLSLLGQWAAEKTGDGPLTVAVVGLTNVGKTSFIDSLLRKAVLPIYQLSSSSDGPTTTVHAQEVVLEGSVKPIRLIDTPGYSWLPSSEQPAETGEATRERDILTRNKGRIERLKDPQPVVHEIVTRANQEDLMLFYNLPAFADKDTEAFLRALARASGLVKKGGVLDTAGASRTVLRDWSTGRFPRYTVPSSSSGDAVQKDAPFTALYANDEKILATLPTRKEMRTSVGLVKLRSSEVESRQLAVDTSWFGSEDSEEEGEEEEEDEEEGAEVDSEDGEEVEEDEEGADEADEEDEDEDEEPELPASKRKRRAIAVASRPAKKVAFSAEPQNTKQARRAAGARGSSEARAKPAAKSKQSQAQPSVKSVLAKKAANAPSKKSAAPAGTGSGDAYDFKMFF